MNQLPLIRILKNGSSIKEHQVDGEFLVGRGDHCDVRLDDRAISREHIFFRVVAEGLEVEKKSDFSSVTLNGAEFTSAVLRPGDVIRSGDYEIQLEDNREKESLREDVKKEEISESVDESQEEVLEAPSFKPEHIEMSQEIVSDYEDNRSPEDEFAGPIDGGLSLEGSQVGEIDLGEPVDSDIELDNDDKVEMEFDSFSESSPEIESGEKLEIEDLGEIKLDGNFDIANDVGPIEVDVPEVEVASEDASTKLIDSGEVAVRLVIPPGKANVEVLEIPENKDEVLMGRGSSCDIILEDKKSSRQNTLIRQVGGVFTIKDLDSSNGTYVNGIKIDEQELSGGDKIRIGDTQIEFFAQNVAYEQAQSQDQFLDVAEAETKSGNLMNQMPSPDESPVIEPMQNLSLDMSAAPPEVKSALNAGIQVGGVTPGIPGMGGASEPKSIFEKFRALPPRKQRLYAVGILLFLWLFLDEEPKKKVKKKNKGRDVAAVQKKKAKGKKSGVKKTFRDLNGEQQRFVEAQHALAFELYKNKEYDKALFEVSKIFRLVDEYKDSREIERYAREGQRKLKAIEEEQRRREEAARVKRQVVELVQETQRLMDQKNYEEAKIKFVEIVSLDPENEKVPKWQALVKEHEDELAIEENNRKAIARANEAAWSSYKEGQSLRKQGKCHSAIRSYKEVFEKGAGDKRPLRKARVGIRACRKWIAGRRDPLLAKGKTLELKGDMKGAYDFYRKASRIDPPHPAGWKGMKRVRGVLHEKAKMLYTEGVLSESYSDFDLAKQKFNRILEVAPKDDVYYGRAKRKLDRFIATESLLNSKENEDESEEEGSEE